MADDEVLANACWALAYMSDDPGPQNNKIQAVIDSGVTGRLVELLTHQSAKVQMHALQTVCNLVTGNNAQTQAVLDCGVLPCLLALLVHPKKSLRQQACWAISNITASNEAQIAAVIAAGLIPPLVAILQSDEWAVQKEAAWAFSNATAHGLDEQIRYLARQGVIPRLCDLFTCPDSNVVLLALEGVENILRVGKADGERAGDKHNQYVDMVEQCGGLDYLQALRQHGLAELRNAARSMLGTYFDAPDDDDT